MSSTPKVTPSFCRNCTAYCPILCTVDDGRVIRVTGDPEAPAYNGYSCPKGRSLPEQHNDLNRLLRPMARQPDGSHAPMAADRAIDDIAYQLQALVARHGPKAVGIYYGTGNVTNPAGSAMARAFANALGTNLVFSAQAIDKPGANISIALHGHWHAGAQAFETADTWLIVGANPVIAKSNGAPMNNPGQRLKEAVERGMKLIVVDPRRTETAKRAQVHLQLRPGEDPTLLAGLIHVILAEQLFDHAFVAQHAVGLDALREAVAPFTPDTVADRAGVPREQLLEAARTFARAKRGGAICATGASFGTHGNLSFYLALCLNTLCGRWAREGDAAPYPNVLLPPFQPRAQPYAPYPVFGNGQLRVHGGLRESACGMPTAALADEILLGGDEGIKALICLGGNPVLSWPDQARTEAALKSLDLLVVLDAQMTATAQLAHYAFGVPLSLETAGSTSRVEALKYIGAARGFTIPWAQYTPAIVPRPAGSDLVEDAAFFFRLAQRLDLKLTWTNVNGYRGHVESPPLAVPLDMSREPSNEELIELTCRNARVPLDEVKKHPHGHVFHEVAQTVAPRDPACTAMLQLGDPMMMAELAAVQHSRRTLRDGELLMVPRRINRVMNSVGHTLADASQPFTPAHMHPEDIVVHGLSASQRVTVRSAHGEITAALHADDTLRRGVVSVVHGFGGRLDDASQTSCSVTRLTAMDEVDPITGMPRLGALPVIVTPAG
jgi:anaerobic selenocysteine-containing dehydrogenase